MRIETFNHPPAPSDNGALILIVLICDLIFIALVYTLLKFWLGI